MQENQLLDFAERYTRAWCSQHAAGVAAFYSADGSLSGNDSAPAVGRTAITGVVQSFMTAFPDMRVVMDQVRMKGGQAEYHWTLTGRDTGGRHRVCVCSFELWQFGADGHIASSQGHFDGAEYERQLASGAGEP